MSATNHDYGLIRTANRAKRSGTWTKRTEPNQADFDLSEPNRAERVTIHIASPAEPSRAEPSRAEPSRAEPSRNESSAVDSSEQRGC